MDVCRLPREKEICFFIDARKSKKDPWFYMSEYIFENNEQNNNYKISTVYKHCSWKPLAVIFNGWANVVHTKHQKDYELLSKFYLENTKRGIFTGALISGSLRSFYLTGHFSDDATDMDIYLMEVNINIEHQRNLPIEYLTLILIYRGIRQISQNMVFVNVFYQITCHSYVYVMSNYT